MQKDDDKVNKSPSKKGSSSEILPSGGRRSNKAPEVSNTEPKTNAKESGQTVRDMIRSIPDEKKNELMDAARQASIRTEMSPQEAINFHDETAGYIVKALNHQGLTQQEVEEIYGWASYVQAVGLSGYMAEGRPQTSNTDSDTRVVKGNLHEVMSDLHLSQPGHTAGSSGRGSKKQGTSRSRRDNRQ